MPRQHPEDLLGTVRRPINRDAPHPCAGGGLPSAHLTAAAHETLVWASALSPDIARGTAALNGANGTFDPNKIQYITAPGRGRRTW